MTADTSPGGRLVRRCLYGWLAACWLAGMSAYAQTTAPDLLAKRVTGEVVELLRAHRDLDAGDSRKLVDLVEAKVLPHFNFTRMTQLAVGRHWRQASTAQREALTEEFRVLLVRTYSTALTAYHDHTIDFRPLRLDAEDRDAVVRAQVRRPGGRIATVDISMEKTADGWKVYDVVIEGVSLVQTYRSTFAGEVQRSGIDGLIRLLGERNRQVRVQAAGG
jgi:phospholipid transport system substrate-binding protein